MTAVLSTQKVISPEYGIFRNFFTGMGFLPYWFQQVVIVNLFSLFFLGEVLLGLVFTHVGHLSVNAGGDQILFYSTESLIIFKTVFNVLILERKKVLKSKISRKR